MKNESYYENMYSTYFGSVDNSIKAVCKNFTFSESYEIAALSNVLHYKIRTVYPKLGYQEDRAILNSVFTPRTSITDNSEIAILWSHVLDENEVQKIYNAQWGPNHFVPLLSSAVYGESDDINQSIPLAAVSHLCVNYNSIPSVFT